MDDFSSYISSEAKIKVLQTVAASCAPFGLREISSISNVPLRSVQNALKWFVKKKIFKRENSNSVKVLFSLNKNHHYSDLAKEFSFFLNKVNLSNKAQDLSSRAKHVLTFNDQMRTLIGKARF